MKKKISMSLALEMFLVSTIAFCIAALAYIPLSVAANAALDYRFGTDQYYRQQDQKILDSLSAYINENQVSSDDWYQLNQWVSRNDIVNLTIYKENLLVYDSQLSEKYTSADTYSSLTNTVATVESDYERELAYQLEFADGITDIIIYGQYASKYYQFAYIIEFVIPCLIFIACVLFAVRKKMKYLIQLCEEVRCMEGGDLDHPITVKGNDEIALLARSVDSLRLSFIQKLARIMQLQEESRSLVTEMSHDLRTPMTPLMVYLGMLREKRYANEEEHDSYVEKSYQKAAQLKHMSDNMFSYFLMDKNADIQLESISMYDAFYDNLSSIAWYLDAEGYQTQIKIETEDVNIMVNIDFMTRIFDNILSNILKYADPDGIISLSLFVENEKVILHTSNRINELADYSSSTGFGVKNIEKMMGQMFAECIIHQQEERYDTFLLFKIVSVSK
jgi:HAMP domain-containing protein